MEYYLWHCFNHNLKWIIQYIWNIPSYVYIYMDYHMDYVHVYIYSWVRHRPSEFGGAVARFLFRCFSRMTICSILFHPWTIYVWKKPNKISPCSISMVFCIYIYMFIFGIHIPMWSFSIFGYHEKIPIISPLSNVFIYPCGIFPRAQWILLGGIPTPLTNDGVTAIWDDLFPINDGKVIKNSMVPPSRIYT